MVAMTRREDVDQKKAVLAILIGNILEKYTTALYVFSTVFLAKYFFPEDQKVLGFLGTFAAGFLIRPIGGLLFGHIGDRIGRKMALVFAIFSVTFTSFVVAILPGYETLGGLASFILVICRILQGISASGEYSGAAVMITERFHDKNKGLLSGLLPATSIGGLFIGACVVWFCSWSIMPVWAWRVPFGVAGVVGVIGLYLRLNLRESPIFEEVCVREMRRQVPVRDLITNDLSAFVCMLIMAATATVAFYLPVVYVSDFMLPETLSKATKMGMNAIYMMTMILGLPVAGHLSDRFGRIPLMIISLLFFAFSVIPLFWVLINPTSLIYVGIAYFLMGLFSAGYVGPSVAFQSSLFPPTERYSGMALGASLGEAIFGGLAPLICMWLASTVNVYVGPALYLITCAVATVALIYSLSYAQRKQLREAFG